jgi:hypothetical protein
MSEQIPENRPSAVAAAWLLHVYHAEANHVGRLARVRRSTETSAINRQAAHRRRRLRKAAAWIHEIGEKLARWRLSFTDYPWNRGD